MRAGVADRDHRLAHALLLVGLLVGDVHAEGVAVVGDGLVQVGHGDADVVDRGEQVLGEVQGCGHGRHRGRCGRCPQRDPRHPGHRGRGAAVSSRTITSHRSCPHRLEAALMSTSVIVAGARTPIGRLLGGLKDQSAADLGGVAIKGALDKAGVSGDQVEYVIMGQVIQAGAGQITARQAAVKGGIPMDVPADHHQQGVPVRHQRDRAGRPADPRRRARDRRGRRHGVDDPGPAPAAEARARASSTATPRSSTRWPTTPSTTSSPTRR